MHALKSLKIAAVMVLVVVTAVFAAGCGRSEQKDNENASDVSGTVKVAGSTSVQPLSEELVAAFEEQYSDVMVNVQGGGSSAGVEAANSGTANIGTSSRELKDEEKAYGLTETAVARDGIAVVVNPANNLADLTVEQVKKIFSGEIKNWNEVGGGNKPITVIVREAGSGTRGAFEEIVLGDDAKFIANAIVQNSTGAVKKGVISDPYAVGFISMGSVDSAVKAVKVDGVAASAETVIDGSYKIARPFLYLTKGEPDAATKAFIEFVLSAEGQQIVAEEFIPVK
ncbi:phosphate ABC transporter substrate-binding protein [Phosphitispora fastidiosa]|uniref:phosphate ABC transporter substrate-binding protein n=1 Tax=Phosphitispora fastidiosa TaxID=2837202 RepID=UPI001E32CC3A|nr:phosphate ABC transporter substrate-binding protein [Phosphitispora fastidiosa]MBU7005499.1 phosphate transport system substrate-binding protein [Phosphitispora fastidiosa]